MFNHNLESGVYNYDINDDCHTTTPFGTSSPCKHTLFSFEGHHADVADYLSTEFGCMEYEQGFGNLSDEFWYTD